MADSMYRKFLISQIQDLKTQLTDPTLDVDTVVDLASEILSAKRSLHRVDNPVKRPRATPTEPQPEAA